MNIFSSYLYIIFNCLIQYDMFGQASLQDQVLKAYVEKVFDKYDADRSGSLDQSQMTVFFNQLFQSLGIHKQVNVNESLEAIKTIDKNFDGKVNKEELFVAFKAMLQKAQMQQQQQVQQPQQPQQGGYYGQPSYPAYGGYGSGYGYGGYGGYPPPPNYGYPQYPPPQYTPPQNNGYYPQSPYYQPQQPQQQPQNPYNQAPMYNSSPNMMNSYTQGYQNQAPQNPNPYLHNSANPYGKK